MIDEDFKAQILHTLQKGKSKAITGSRLADYITMTTTTPIHGTRQLRLAINSLIEDGHPIVFCDKGYYLAETPEECKEALKKLRSYGVNLFRHYKYLKRAMNKRFSGQLIFERLD